MTSWLDDREMGAEAGEELMQLLSEAAPSLGILHSSSPSARRTGSRTQSKKAVARLRGRMDSAVPMSTGKCRLQADAVPTLC